MSFSHVNLNQVDPNLQVIPAGVYQVQVQKAEVKTYVAKSGKNAGKESERVDLQLAIVNDPNHTSRRLFPVLFSGDISERILRRIMDASGIAQDFDGGETIPEWLPRLAVEQAQFRVAVEVVPDVNFDGTPNAQNVKTDPITGVQTPGDKNQVNWKTLLPPA